MLRFSSFLMVLLLTVLIVRDCCLPESHSLPCHQTKHTDDVTCASAVQAIVEGKTFVAERPPIACSSLITIAAASGMFPQIQLPADGVIPAGILTTDIYLRTGALLI